MKTVVGHGLPYHAPRWKGRDQVVREDEFGRKSRFVRPRRPRNPPAKLLEAAVALAHRGPASAATEVVRLAGAGLDRQAIKRLLEGRFAGHKLKKALARTRP